MSVEDRDKFRDSLLRAFSGFRAEGLGVEIFRLFTKPAYFPHLTTDQPCFLVGGRGTGKTTALRCLSYHGQVALDSETGKGTRPAGSWQFVGLYHRVNTNRVTAFRGPELREDRWISLFAHYLNLEFTELILRFLVWFEQTYPSSERLRPRTFLRLATSLHLSEASNASSLLDALDLSRIRFEAVINNVVDSGLPALSLQGAPIDLLLADVKCLPQFTNTTFLFLLDEYENYDESQQRVLNTLVKHCGEHYSFKVGVREFGILQRSTLNEHEHLAHPADYRLIDINKELSGRFSDFAASVCNQRLSSVFGPDVPDVPGMFPELSPEQEALLLGIIPILRPLLQPLRQDPALDDEMANWIESVHPLETYTLLLRANAEQVTVVEKLSESIRDRAKWKQQYENHKYAYLFSLRRGKRGIRKHYCGWTVFCQLAASNLRFMLQLVEQSLSLHSELDSKLRPINYDLQTKAAHATAHTNFLELESRPVNGRRLARLLLGLGRIFQVMSEDPVGHTPEVNQFHLYSAFSDDGRRADLLALLKEGIMHLAMLWYPASKLQQTTDLREFDYAIHPLYSAFFGFSHRRKRKIRISDSDLWTLIEDPPTAIKKLLQDQNRPPQEDLPDQLALFSEYYDQ